MNRKQRRNMIKQGINVKSEPVINIKVADVQNIKKQATNEAVDTAFTAMLAIPMLVMRDRYGFGRKRLEKFMDEVFEVYDSFNNDYLTLDDMHKALKDEVGFTIKKV